MNENSGNSFPAFSVILHNFWRALSHMFWFPLILTIVVGCVFGVRTKQSYYPIYTSSASFSVKANYYSTTDLGNQGSYLNSNAATQLAATFPYVIESETTRALLSQELGRNAPSLTIVASSVADAALFTITVSGARPQDVYEVLNALIAIYPQAASSILGDTQIEVIDRPLVPPSKPSNSDTTLRTTILAAAGGLLVGLAVVFLISLTRKTVHSAEDLHKLVNIKCLAYVPGVRLKKRSNQANLSVLITNPRISVSFSESIRNLRVKLQKVIAEKGGKVIMVTSTLPGEGKTTVSTNLALSLAAEGKRVILVDGDLRKQNLKSLLGVTGDAEGLVEILSDTSSNFHLLNVPNSTLLLLSGSQTTDAPQPLLDSPRMRQLIDLLRDRLDFIIIDTPPAGVLSDAATVSKYVDATLYVVRQDVAGSIQIQNSIQSLSVSEANIVGCVLNCTQQGTTRYGYSSKYGNKYGYGYKRSYGYGYGYAYRAKDRYYDAKRTAEELTEELEFSTLDRKKHKDSQS